MTDSRDRGEKNGAGENPRPELTHEEFVRQAQEFYRQLRQDCKELIARSERIEAGLLEEAAPRTLIQ